MVDILERKLQNYLDLTTIANSDFAANVWFYLFFLNAKSWGYVLILFMN